MLETGAGAARGSPPGSAARRRGRWRGPRRRHRRRAQRQLADRAPRARALRADPGSVGTSLLARHGRSAASCWRRCSSSRASRGWRASRSGCRARASRAFGRPRAFYARQRLRAARRADAADLSVNGDAGPQLLMIEQRRERGGAVPWILDERGRRMPGYDDGRRLSEVQAGLMRHDRVSAHTADASARGRRSGAAPAARARLPAGARARPRPRAGADRRAAPNPACSPTPRSARRRVATAREGVGTAITAARAIVAGARFSYALCRPPGHHAGPGWLGGYCYLNNAAAAAQTLHDGGVAPGRDPRPRPALPQRHRSAAGAYDRHEPALAARLHRREPPLGASAPPHRPRAPRRVSQRPRERDLPGGARALHPHARASPPTRSFCRSATTSSRATPTARGAFGRRSSSGSAGCWLAPGLPVCVVQEGGYALESLAGCSHAFATGLLERRPGVSAPGRETASASGLEPFRRRLDELDERDRAAARRAVRDLS